MCACNGTGVIHNDIGMGMYQVEKCICNAVISPEESKRKHEEWVNNVFDVKYAAWKESQESQLGIGA